jgi:hypothetical protein
VSEVNKLHKHNLLLIAAKTLFFIMKFVWEPQSSRTETDIAYMASNAFALGREPVAEPSGLQKCCWQLHLRNNRIERGEI